MRITENPNETILKLIVTQSSGAEFHCLTITLFYTGVSEEAA